MEKHTSKLITSNFQSRLSKILLLFVLLALSVSAYADVITSNGTGKYVITGDDTWGLSMQNETVSSIAVNKGANLALRWSDSVSYTVGNIYGDGSLEIYGGGLLTGEWAGDVSGGQRALYEVYGVKSIKNITLSASGDLPGMFDFCAFPYVSDYTYKSMSFADKNFSAENVRLTPASDASCNFYKYSNNLHDDVTVNGGDSVSVKNCDFAVVGSGNIFDASMAVNGDSSITVSDSTVKNDSLSHSLGYTVGSISGGAFVTTSSKNRASYTLSGKSTITIKNVTVDSPESGVGELAVWGAGHSYFMGDSSEGTAISEIGRSSISLEGIHFTGHEKPTMIFVWGGGLASTLRSGDFGKYVQTFGRAENRITGLSEIVINGNGAFSGLANGYIFCGGVVIGERAVSTVGSARLTFKDIDMGAGYKEFAGIISGQGQRNEYLSDGTPNGVSDYMDSVLGDSVLVLDNVKADISSNDVNVKYFDEIVLKNNTAVKMTTFDSDVKNVTISGTWSSANGSVDAVTFNRAVENRSVIRITVDADAAASGVTKAAWSDDGMKLIVYTSNVNPTPTPAPSDGSSGGGGCDAGVGALAIFALAGLFIVKKS